MAADAHALRGLITGLCLLAPAVAGAFEPGRDRVCAPSADGQRFECHDKATGAPDPARQEEPVARRARAYTSVPVARPPATAVESAPAATATREPPADKTASTLPSYLRSSAAPVTATSSPQPTASAPIAAPVATAPPVNDTRPAQPGHAGAPTVVAPQVSKPAAPVSPPPATAAAIQPASVAPAQPVAATLADARSFRRLDPTRYTLELARSSRREELATLAQDLHTLDAALHLVALRAPDGVTWRLLWSDFPDVDAARAARARLPDDSRLGSVWPRRIGPLQAELTSP